MDPLIHLSHTFGATIGALFLIANDDTIRLGKKSKIRQVLQ